MLKGPFEVELCAAAAAPPPPPPTECRRRAGAVFVTSSRHVVHQLYVARSHTRTVVRECFKGDEASQWKRPKFDPSPHQNPLTDLHKNWQA